MVNYKNVHVIMIGYHKSIPQYRINLDLYRENFSFGKDIWITTLYEGEDKHFITGLSENTYIKTDVSGYAFGALEQINKGLEFAMSVDRDIIVLHNFDVLFFEEKGFNLAIQEFIDSGKFISAAEDVNGLLATDIMMFRKEILKYIIPIKTNHCEYREALEIAERYKNTELGWANVEEWFFNAVCAKEIIEYMGIKNPIELDNTLKNNLKNNVWHKMSRFDLPRLRWSEKLSLGHLHSLGEIKEYLIKFKINNGNVVKHIISSNF